MSKNSCDDGTGGISFHVVFILSTASCKQFASNNVELLVEEKKETKMEKDFTRQSTRGADIPYPRKTSG